MDTPAQTKRIVILGGGFGGLYAALYLDRTVARDPGVEVLLIDPQNFTVFTPMLHEVASGSLDANSIVVPIRQALRHVEFLEAEATAIDLATRTVTITYGLEGRTDTIRFDQLLIALGSQTRFPPGLRRQALGMKTIYDALLLRNWLIGILERAEIEDDVARRRELLTFVVAGGGFSGVETVGAINDFIREIAPHYRRVSAESLSLVLVTPGERLLPEFEPVLGRYAESKLREAGIDVRLHTKVADFDGRLVSLQAADDSDGHRALSARTLIWTAGITPSPLIESLALPKDRGRIVVTGTMALPGLRGRMGMWRLRGHTRRGRASPIRRPHNTRFVKAPRPAAISQPPSANSPRRSARFVTRCSGNSPQLDGSAASPASSACGFRAFLRGSYGAAPI